MFNHIVALLSRIRGLSSREYFFNIVPQFTIASSCIQPTMHEKKKLCEPGISVLITLCLLCAPMPAQRSAGADNLYCRPGNVAGFGANDGPAALPQACFYTALSGTPSPGKEIRVPAPGGLQKAIETARCGDTLTLAAGAEYTGGFEFPPKGCDDAHWITVRTGGKIPPEGIRITPCFAGIASLPGRPRYSCPAPDQAMAKLIVPLHSAISVSNYYRFIGLEITRPEGGGNADDLVRAAGSNKIIFDRVWMHGTPKDETKRGLAFQGATYLAVIDSYLSDFHCIARTGSCTDSQTVWAGAGPEAGGIYKIVNNYLESSGEGILFGGAAGSSTPVDIEIRRNHFYKPLTWKPSDPTFIGTTFIAKNNFELKNASRVLLEGNVLENSWGGFSQAGFQLLLTPKNADNRCPLCIVKDVTIRYNVMRHSGAGMQLVSTRAGAGGGLSQGLMNVSIHDVIIEDINPAGFAGNGFALQISNDGPTYHDLTIDHITIPDAGRALLLIGSLAGSPLRNISITNSVLDVGKYQVWSTGGRQNCAFQKPSPQDILDSCWSPYSFTNNILIGARQQWPKGNFFANNAKDVFASVGGEKVDFQLQASAHRGKAKEGKDPGADVPRVLAAIAGVE